MKTQIKNLRIGAKQQWYNPDVNYSKCGNASSHNGGIIGTNRDEVDAVWEKIKAENPITLKIKLKGEIILLKRQDSISGLSTNYFASLPESLQGKFVNSTKKKEDSLSIYNGNYVDVFNGKNGHINLCPSFIEILD